MLANVAVGKDVKELHLIDMNANGPSVKGRINTRKQSIAQLLREENPLVVFMQEFVWKDIHSRAWKEIDVPDYYQYIGHKEAGFVYDTREVTVTRLDHKTKVIRIYESLQRRPDFLNRAERSRMSICMMESKGVPDFKLLCISWHGPHYRYSTDRKTEVIRFFGEMVILMRNEFQCPVIVGGDFNLKAEIVEKCIPKELHVIRPSEHSIDMFLFDNKSITVNKAELIKWTDEEINNAFDHDPLKLTFQLQNQK